MQFEWQRIVTPFQCCGHSHLDPIRHYLMGFKKFKVTILVSVRWSCLGSVSCGLQLTPPTKYFILGRA